MPTKKTDQTKNLEDWNPYASGHRMMNSIEWKKQPKIKIKLPNVPNLFISKNKAKSLSGRKQSNKHKKL